MGATDADSGCPRCLVAMWLWHGTLPGVPHALRTSGAAFPFVIERLSNPPARLQEASPRACLRWSLRSSIVTALTRGCPASFTRGACMPLGPHTVWERMSKAHMHWVPVGMAIAFCSAAGYPHHERAVELDTVKYQDRVDKRLSRIVYAWSRHAPRSRHLLAQARKCPDASQGRL